MAISGYRRFQAREDRLYGACIGSPWNLTNVASCLMAAQLDSPGAWEEDEKLIRCAANHLRWGTCSCGLNAYKDRDYDGAELWSEYFLNNVTAAVTGWGWVVEYEYGYRVEHMQIEHLWLDGPVSPEKEQQAAALSMRYGVGCDISPSVVATSVRQVEAREYVWSENGCQVVFGTEVDLA